MRYEKTVNVNGVWRKLYLTNNSAIQTIWRKGAVKPSLWKFEGWRVDNYLAFDFFVGKSLFTVGLIKGENNAA